MIRSTPTPTHRYSAHPYRRAATAIGTPWLRLGVILMLYGALFNAVLIVQSLNLYHAIVVDTPVNLAVALRHAHTVYAIERLLHLAIEPALQNGISHGIATPLGVLSGAMLRQWAVWLYINAVPSWLFAALTWCYLFRRERFAWLRDLTIVSAFLSVACYRLYPVAPPRFALEAAPYHMQDWTYGGTSVDSRILHLLGFNPYAAFPSVHLLWALIPTLCLLVGSRPFWMWFVAPIFSVVMMLTVIVTGNHYIIDCMGAVAVLAVSTLITLGIERCQQRLALWMERRHIGIRRHMRPLLPAVPSLALICAGTLAVVGIHVRVLMALDIVILLAACAYRCRTLLHTGEGQARMRGATAGFDDAAGVLFIAGATAAAHAPSRDAVLGAFLWLLACLCAIAGHRYARLKAWRSEPRDAT